MADLNIRNVDETLLASLKSEAALLGTNLKSYVMCILVSRIVPVPVPAEWKSYTSTANSGTITGIPRSAAPLVAKAVKSTIREHDPKTCNVYKCGMCAALNQ